MRLVSHRSNVSVLERPDNESPNPVLPVDQQPSIEIYLRPGVAEDLLLLNSWFQNPIVNRYSQMPKTWRDTLDWWKALDGRTVVSMMVLVDRSNPMSFYCGRSIGYVQWDDLDKEYPSLFMTVGDWAMFSQGIGTKALLLASKQLFKLKRNGKFHTILHPEAKMALSMASKYRDLGIVKSIESMESGWVNVIGEFR